MMPIEGVMEKHDTSWGSHGKNDAVFDRGGTQGGVMRKKRRVWGVGSYKNWTAIRGVTFF